MATPRRRRNPWRDHKIVIAASVVALLIVVAVVADKNDVYPCKGRKRTHKGQTYRVRTCFRIKEATPKIHGASPVQHKIEFLVDGRWVDTMEFWNVSAAGAWESAEVANKYAIGLIDNRLAGRQYPDMYGEPPDSPYYHENDPEALRRSKQWKAQYGHN